MEMIDRISAGSATNIDLQQNLPTPRTQDFAQEQSFQSVMESAQNTSAANKNLSPSQEKVVSEYTSIITTQFISMVLEEQSGMFDSEDASSEHYHSMMVEAVSEHLTKTDALGLKSLIQWEISKW